MTDRLKDPYDVIMFLNEHVNSLPMEEVYKQQKDCDELLFIFRSLNTLLNVRITLEGTPEDLLKHRKENIRGDL